MSLRFLAGLLVCFLAQAGETPLSQSRCVSRSIEQVHDRITDYSKYSDWDDHIYDNLKVEFQSGQVILLQLINMVLSKPLIGSTADDAHVLISMRPLGLHRARGDLIDFYPRFVLHCQLKWLNPAVNGKGFQQVCKQVSRGPLDDPKQEVEYSSFGLKAFSATVDARENSEKCPGKVEVKASVQYESNEADVQALFSAISSAPMLGPVLAKELHSKTFYDQYFMGFYDALIQQLGK